MDLKLVTEVVEHPKFDEENRQLIGHVRINGVDHHVTLFQTVDLLTVETPSGDDPHGGAFDMTFGDQAPASAHSERYQALQNFESTGETFRTVEFGGREYICVITPFTR